MANRFILVANLEAEDGGKAIIEGNERVIRARLSDAKFFWDQDRKVKLEDRLPELKDIIFHEKLSTQAERVERLKALARELAPVAGADPDKAERAAELSKADLVTGMVGEFPDLQGLMGKYYALEQGEDASVAAAIEEHYRPLGPNDAVPTDPVSIAVALADKLDTLVGFWAVDEKPTGSRDPYALRRAALGVIRIVLENKFRKEISNSIPIGVVSYLIFGFRPKAVDHYDPGYRSLLGEQVIDGVVHPGNWEKSPYSLLLGYDGFLEKSGDLAAQAEMSVVDEDDEEKAYSALKELQRRVENLETLCGPADFAIADGTIHDYLIKRSHDAVIQGVSDKISDGLLAFFHDRLKVYLRDRGARHDLIDAVISPDADDLLMIVARVEALGTFLDTDDGANLLTGVDRATSILRIEEKKDGKSYDGAPDASLLKDTEEKTLAKAIDEAAKKASAAIEKEDFEAAMRAIAKLRKPVDDFFDNVTVNADDPALRENRLKLLNQIREATLAVADFSKIEG